MTNKEMQTTKAYTLVREAHYLLGVALSELMGFDSKDREPYTIVREAYNKAENAMSVLCIELGKVLKIIETEEESR